METREKVSLLREQMKANNLSAFIVYSADPHMSEYLPEYWLERAWISGFTGSAGFAVFTLDKAGVWTDSRYFVQAAAELNGTGIDLFKEGVEGTPNYIDWLLSELPEGTKVGVNGLCTAHSNWELLSKKLQSKKITLEDLPLLEKVWKERPKDAENPIFVHPLEYAGQSVEDKLAKIRSEMAKKYAVDSHIVTSLDDVAWITNLRGSDVAYNPVFLGYLHITNTSARLFTNLKKCDEVVKKHLQQSGIELVAYEDFFTELSKLKGQKILISANANETIFQTLQGNNECIEAEPISQLLKAVKNKTELEGFRSAMVKDGVAMVNFLYWLENQVGKEEMDEYSIGRTLESFRAEQTNFVGNSFGEIVGYQGNGAIVHYSAKKESAKKVTNEGTILIDSGGQYREGTTDLTRVVVLGNYSEDFKKDYTLVLKGMIDLAIVKFVKGTRGVQLDAFARMPLWLEHKDYGHGTGHGVGSFLNVHEGPQNIRKDLKDIPLLEGMVCSDEPGLYIENKYGIRIENLVAVQKDGVSDFGEFFSFEVLTLCPIETSCIEVSLLTEKERNWLNSYHKQVEKALLPFLQAPQQQWLKEKCRAI
ncbi:MAG: aminopeptidase P family protein [Capnocytophaga sp.]|nr:aminopeptidase P family protein [Capnocytophaga sp.]